MKITVNRKMDLGNSFGGIIKSFFSIQKDIAFAIHHLVGNISFLQKNTSCNGFSPTDDVGNYSLHFT